MSKKRSNRNYKQSPHPPKIELSYLLGLVVVIFLFVVIIKINVATDNLIGQVMKMQQVTINSIPTNRGFISVPLASTEANNHYINILIDANQDKNWQAYQTNNGRQPEWIVKNMAIMITPESINSFTFPIVDPTLRSQKDIPIHVVLSEKPLHTTQEILKPNKNTTAINQIIKKIYTHDIATKFALRDIEGSAGLDLNLWREVRDGVAAKIDTTQNFEITQTQVPDISQETNECAIAATSNGYIWYKQNHDTLPAITGNPVLLNEQLKNYLGWSIRHGVFMHTDYASGMHQLNQSFDTNVATYPLDTAFSETLFDSIAQSIYNGQVVVADLEYRSKADKRSGGHVVTIVGTKKEGDTQYLFLHDPLSPGPHIDIYKLENNELIDYRYGQKTLLRFAFAQSVIPDNTYELAISPQKLFFNFPATFEKQSSKIGTFTIEPDKADIPWFITPDMAEIFTFSRTQGFGEASIDVYLNHSKNNYFPYINDRVSTIAVYSMIDDKPIVMQYVDLIPEYLENILE